MNDTVENLSDDYEPIIDYKNYFKRWDELFTNCKKEDENIIENLQRHTKID